MFIPGGRRDNIRDKCFVTRHRNTPPLPTLREIQQSTPWVWLNRADHQCGHHVATTLAWAVERDREEELSKAAQSKLYRERQAAQALKDNEENRLATLAKTARLRAERLAREAEEPQINKPRKRGMF